MTIDISTVKQKRPIPVSRGQQILASQYEALLNATQATYKFSNRVIYSDIRNIGLTGYYYGNAPWYYEPVSTDSNWVGQVCKLPYKPSSPLSGSNINTVATAPVNPVSSSTPSLLLEVQGCNLEFFIQIERVTVNIATGIITYTGDSSRYSNTLAGVYNSGSPWLSAYDVDSILIGLPEGTEPESILLIDFYCRGSNDDEDSPGFLGYVTLSEPQFPDFPQGSY